MALSLVDPDIWKILNRPWSPSIINGFYRGFVRLYVTFFLTSFRIGWSKGALWLVEIVLNLVWPDSRLGRVSRFGFCPAVLVSVLTFCTAVPVSGLAFCTAELYKGIVLIKYLFQAKFACNTNRCTYCFQFQH